MRVPMHLQSGLSHDSTSSAPDNPVTTFAPHARLEYFLPRTRVRSLLGNLEDPIDPGGHKRAEHEEVALEVLLRPTCDGIELGLVAALGILHPFHSIPRSEHW